MEKFKKIIFVIAAMIFMIPILSPFMAITNVYAEDEVELTVILTPTSPELTFYGEKGSSIAELLGHDEYFMHPTDILKEFDGFEDANHNVISSDEPVNENKTIYIKWRDLQPLTEINITLDAPIIGDEVEIIEDEDEEGDIYYYPSLYPDIYSNEPDKYEFSEYYWASDTCSKTDNFSCLDYFEGTFEADTDYYATITVTTSVWNDETHSAYTEYAITDEALENIKINNEEPDYILPSYDKYEVTFVKKIRAQEEVIPDDPDENYYDVIFDTRGGSAVATQSVLEGEYAVKPSNPNKINYVFKGWYTDTDYSEEFDFNTPIYQETRVYAKWEDVSVDIDVDVDTINFGVVNKGFSNIYRRITVHNNSNVAVVLTVANPVGPFDSDYITRVVEANATIMFDCFADGSSSYAQTAGSYSGIYTLNAVDANGSKNDSVDISASITINESSTPDPDDPDDPDPGPGPGPGPGPDPVTPGIITKEYTVVNSSSTSEQVHASTDLATYINNKKQAWINSLSTMPEWYQDFANLFTTNGSYKYPVYLATVFTKATLPSGEECVSSNPADCSAMIAGGDATYHYEVRYKEVTVTHLPPEKIKSLDINVKAPTIGTTITTTSRPKVTVNSNIYEVQTTNYVKNPPSMSESGLPEVYSEDVEVLAGTDYYVGIVLQSKTGYIFDSNQNMKIKINGQPTNYEVDKHNVEGNNNYILYAKVKSANPIYEFIEGAGQTINKTIANEATFRIDANYILFAEGGKVFVDNKELTEKDFDSKEGSTIITLKKEYLSTLDVGEHTIKVVFNNEGTATTTFTVSENDSSIPMTGDSIMTNIIMLIISTIGLFSVIATTRLKILIKD